jgi:hypothetical protein
MGRGILIALLALGTVLGFGMGFAHHRHHHWGHGYGRPGYGPHALEDRAAEACLRAAERLGRERGANDTPQAPAPPPAAPVTPPAP